jgi:hypothetical protein
MSNGQKENLYGWQIHQSNVYAEKSQVLDLEIVIMQ